MKVVLQDGIKDCGICSLLSIIRHYGGDVSREYLRGITNTSKDGVSAYNLVEAANTIGLEAYGCVGDLTNINNNNLPCIAHVNVNSNYQHFIVIYKILDNKIIVMDPAKGKRVLTFSEFREMSTGNFIFITKKKKLPILKKKNIIYNNILNTIKNNFTQFLTLTIISTNILILDILFAFNFKYILEYAVNYKVDENIYLIISFLVILNIFISIFNILSRKLLMKLILKLDSLITSSVFKQLVLLPYFYYKNRTTGEVLSRFNDLSTIKNYYIKIFSSLITDLFSIIIFFIILFNISKHLTIYLVIYSIVSFLFIFIRKNKKKRLLRSCKSYEDKVQSYMVEAISNVDTTKGSHLEKRFYDTFYLKYNKLLDKSYKYTSYINNSSSFNSFIYYILNIVIYGAGGYLVINNKLNLPNLIIYQSFYNYFLRSFNKIIELVEEYSTYKVSLDRIEELFNCNVEDFTNNYYFNKYRLNGSIKFNNLTYSVNGKKIFNKLNLEIKNKDKVLLFGRSGSGKSTLFKMLLRYIDCRYKNITINDIDINHYHLENLRSYINYVSSNELIFNDTLYNNICLYKDVSDEEFLKVCRICKLDLFIGNSIDDYKVMVEENGSLFSSGERQRIILARSLLTDSDIYIFDEAFGQIDVNLTNMIMNEAFSYLKDKTVIVISHRHNGKKYFNRVLYLEDGVIHEEC